MEINSTNASINFNGYKTSFSKKFENFMKNETMSAENLSDLQNSLRDVVSRKMTPKYYMGEGRFNKVYRIDDYYVLRLNKDYLPSVRKPMKISQIAQNLKTYCGNVIAKFGNVSIVKNAIGNNKDTVSAGIPFELLTASPYKRKLAMIKSLKTFAKLPQSAYDKVAKDFAELNKQSKGYGLKFDCYNPNNFIKVGNQIKIVDDISEGFSRHDCLDMLNVFMKEYKLPMSENTKKLKRTIFKKCILAASKNNLAIHPNKMQVLVARLYPNEFFSDFKNNIETLDKLPTSKKELQFKKYFRDLDKR